MVENPCAAAVAPIVYLSFAGVRNFCKAGPAGSSCSAVAVAQLLAEEPCAERAWKMIQKAEQGSGWKGPGEVKIEARLKILE